MSSVVKWLCVATLAGLLAWMWSSHQLVAQRAPLSLIRVYTGPDGLSHAEKIDLKMRPSGQRTGLDDSEPVKVSSAQFVRWPRGYVWEWHTASQPQYVITVGGRGEVEVAGGQKFQLTPGQVVLAEDVTGKGHITRSTGSEDLVLMLVPLVR